MTVKGSFNVVDRSTKKRIQIAYEIYGVGQKHVVLISGLCCSREWWSIQAKFLSHQGYQVLTIDNRGVGHSDVPNGNYTIKDMSEDVVQLLDHLNWKSNNHVVGTSMGGMIAMQLASDYPSYVASLCLASTTAKWQPSPLPSALPRVLDPTNPNQEAEMIQVEYPKEWLNAKNPYNPRQTNHEYIIELYQTRLSSSVPPTPAGYARQLWAVEHYDIGEKGLERIIEARYPILICTGDADNVISASNSRFLATKLKAPLELFKGCGHNICVQEWERLNRVLSSYFSTGGISR
ncbi:Alpha/Beta hydrolase protein [Syncephalis plumigaleata]|nr:Alpha/Beta hydrolase protein [Syncephalis plumigaleata]